MVTAVVRQRRRLWLAGAAIALSVGYLAGALTLLNRVSEGLTDLSAAGIEKADLVIEGDVAYESALEQTRRLISSSIALSLVGEPGVAAAIPRVEDIAVILDASGNPLVTPGLTEQPIGANWPDDPRMSPFRFVGSGHAPRGPDEVVIDDRSAARGHLAVGDDVAVVARSAVGRYRIVGIVTTSRGEMPSGSSLAMFTTDRARELFAMPDTDNRVAIRVDPSADVAEVRSSIERSLPAGTVVVTGAEAALHRQASVNRSFTLVRSLIIGFAGLALVVGMVTAANSLTLLYSERKKTFATFRLVGAKRHQMLVAALAEAGVLAVLASLAGIPIGLILGTLIEAVLGAIGTSLPVGGSWLSPSALGSAVLVGTGATVLAAVVPAWRACGTPAIEAITPSEASTPQPFRDRAARLAVTSLIVGLVVWAFAIITEIASAQAVVLGVAVTAVIFGLGILPTGLASAVAMGIMAFPERSSALRRIGARDAVRNRTRTAATTGALLLATAVVSGIAVFLASFSAALDGDVLKLIKADLVVDSGTFTVGGLPAGLLDEVRKVDGVGAVSGWQLGRVFIDDLPARITGMDAPALDQVLQPGWTPGSAPPLDYNAIALAEPMARELGVAVGDSVEVRFTSEVTQVMKVSGIYTIGDVLLGSAIINRSLLSDQIPKSIDITGLVSVKGGEKTVPRVREQVGKLAANYGIRSVLEPAEFVGSRSELLRGFERVIQWMLLFTLIQALVGVINTLLLSVGERRREFGLLRAAGATREQVLRVVLIEGGSFAVVGTLLGIIVGVIGAWVAMQAIKGFGLSGFVLPVPMLVVTAVAAAGLGILAAIVPARWAANVPPLEALLGTSSQSSAPGLATIIGRAKDLARAAGIFQRHRIPADGVPTSASAPPPYTERTAPSDGESVVAAQTVRAAQPHPAPPPPPSTPTRPAMPQPPVTPPRPTPPQPPSTPPRPTPPQPPSTPPRPAMPPPSPGSQRPPEQPRPTAPHPGQEQARPDRPWIRSEPAASHTTDGHPPGAGTPPPVGAPPHQPGPEAPGVVFSPTASPRRRSHATRAEVVVPEPLRPVAARLDPMSVNDAGALLGLLVTQLGREEHVVNMVQGWVKGLPCVVARTEDRLLVVVSRFPEPLVQSLRANAIGISTYGPPNIATVSMSIVDGRRMLDVNGIRDRPEAIAMSKKPGATKVASSGYF